GFDTSHASDPHVACDDADASRPDFALLDIRIWMARAAELAQLRNQQQSLLDALHHQRSIGPAVGVIMERHGLTAEGAFEALRRRARHERQSLATLASAVVAGTVSLQPKAAAD